MISEIIWHNMAWFVAWLLSGILGGIIWEWNRKIGLAIFMVAILAIIISAVVLVTGGWSGTGSESALSNVRPWYYFIGSGCGGLMCKSMVDAGKSMYRSAVEL